MLYNKVIKTTIHDFQTLLYLYFSFLQYCSFLVISKTTFLRLINKFVFSFLWLDQYSLHQRSLLKSYFIFVDTSSVWGIKVIGQFMNFKISFKCLVQFS